MKAKEVQMVKGKKQKGHPETTWFRMTLSQLN